MKKPKTIKKLKRLKLPKPEVRHLLKATKSTEERVSDALSNVPRITNDTVSDHREEVLSSARKYIYPLQHSKHRVVRISLTLLLLVVVGFFAFTALQLYKFQSTSGFTYEVTRIVPFPVAKTGHNWVSYESYLFELRRNMHYYQTQQQANFSTPDGKAQLKHLKQQALDRVIQESYVEQLALQNHVSVSNQTVNDQVAIVRSENHLGSSERAFNEALSEFFGWNQADFKRELKQELLAQAVVSKLDTATNARAQAALKQLRSGADFATLASKTSDDNATRAAGGQYPTAITYSNSDLAPVIIAELFKLKPGQISGVINTGYTLDIVKVISVTGNSRQAAHIQFTLAPISTYIKPLQAKQPVHQYIKF